MQYLADKMPRQTIYPSETRARADVNRWLFWCGQHLTPAIAILNWEHVIKGMLGVGAPDPVEVARGEGLVREFAGVLDAHLLVSRCARNAIKDDRAGDCPPHRRMLKRTP